MPVTLSSNSYPDSGLPFGTQVHENIKHFHSGAIFGVPPQAMNLLTGFSLTFLSLSGIVMFVRRLKLFLIPKLRSGIQSCILQAALPVSAVLLKVRNERSPHCLDVLVWKVHLHIVSVTP